MTVSTPRLSRLMTVEQRRRARMNDRTAPPTGDDDVVRAHRFVLVDSDGTDRAKLEVTPMGAAQLALVDVNTGESRLGLRLDACGPLIYFDGRDGKGGMEIRLIDPDHPNAAEGSTGFTDLTFYDPRGSRRRLVLGIGWEDHREKTTPVGVVLFDVDQNGMPGAQGTRWTYQRPRRRRAVEPIVEGQPIVEEPTTTPEATLRQAGISSRRQARYQRRLSSLLAGRV